MQDLKAYEPLRCSSLTLHLPDSVHHICSLFLVFLPPPSRTGHARRTPVILTYTPTCPPLTYSLTHSRKQKNHSYLPTLVPASICISGREERGVIELWNYGTRTANTRLLSTETGSTDLCNVLGFVHDITSREWRGWFMGLGYGKVYVQKVSCCVIAMASRMVLFTSLGRLALTGS